MSAHALAQSGLPAKPRRRRARTSASSARVNYRAGSPTDAPALHALISTHLEEGHLLARDRAELAVHAARFVVAVRRERVVACAELAALSASVAEIRSLVVDRGSRSRGIGSAIVGELERQARLHGFERLCAFTHDAAYFVRMGFSIVPHVWVPEKIALDCHRCPKFRRCDQYAVMLPLGNGRQNFSAPFVPLASLRG